MSSSPTRSRVECTHGASLSPSRLDPPTPLLYFAAMTSPLLELRAHFVGSQAEAGSIIESRADEAHIRITEERALDVARTEFAFAAPRRGTLAAFFDTLRFEGFILTLPSQKELDDATRGGGQGEMLAKLLIAVQDVHG